MATGDGGESREGGRQRLGLVSVTREMRRGKVSPSGSSLGWTMGLPSKRGMLLPR